MFDKEIEVYGIERKRQLIYVNDVIEIIWLISQKKLSGFVPLNVTGYSISIANLAEKIIKIVGKGRISIKEIPGIIKNIDIGNAIIDDKMLSNLIGKVHLKKIDNAITETTKYFKENLN